MVLAEALLALLLLPVFNFAPGYFFVRRLRWNPLETLCASVAISTLIAYLATWTVYLLTGRIPMPFAWAFAAIACSALFASRRHLLPFLRLRPVRRALAAFAFLLLWTLLMLAMIRIYTGADWLGDWLEHFQRSLFFLHGFPKQTEIFGGYKLPARPPMMNVLAALYMALTQDHFAIFQIAFAFLNLLLFLPCLLILPALSARLRPRTRLIALTAVFATSPVLMQAFTYTWTKAFAAFFVVLALWLYLAAARKRDPSRRVAAFLCLAAGMLVHYSAGPYLVIVGLHYFITSIRRRMLHPPELGAIAMATAMVLCTWFGWSAVAFGAQDTFASNTTVTSSRQYQGSNLEKIAGNLYDTVVPPLLRDLSLFRIFHQPDTAGTVRDYAFVLYQTNFIFAMGIAGGIVITVLFLTRWRTMSRTLEGRFWRALVPCALLLGIAVVGERNARGSAHLTLLPVIALGLTWLAAQFSRRRALALLLCAGLAIDFGFGVFLQARVENWENSPGRTVFNGFGYTQGHITIGQPMDMTQRTWSTWLMKHQQANSSQWLRQLDALPPGAQAMPRTAQLRTYLRDLAAQDATMWQGWYSRHGGSVSYFGDYFGESLPLAALMLALCAGLLATLWRSLPPPAKSPAANPPAKPSRRKRP